MGEPTRRKDGPQIFHVNFHTMRTRPVFEVPEYHQAIQIAFVETVTKWNIQWLAWQLMPTQLHVIVVTFPDRSLSQTMRLLKGATARAVLMAAPELRAELGDHLWQEGYSWVGVRSQRQCVDVVAHVQENRVRGGLVD